ncbi:16442_t:CDS:1, partial [Acaulospora morrowiae]
IIHSRDQVVTGSVKYFLTRKYRDLVNQLLLFKDHGLLDQKWYKGKCGRKIVSKKILRKHPFLFNECSTSLAHASAQTILPHYDWCMDSRCHFYKCAPLLSPMSHHNKERETVWLIRCS